MMGIVGNQEHFSRVYLVRYLGRCPSYERTHRCQLVP